MDLLCRVALRLRAGRETDSRVLERLRAGELEALAELYDEHSAVAYRLACTILSDADLAAEALEAGFLDVWRRAQTDGGEEDLAAAHALLGAVYRACVRRRGASGPRSAGRGSLLDALPDEQRDAIVLTHVAGLTVQQTASIVSRTREQVHRDVLHGLRTVREPIAATG